MTRPVKFVERPTSWRTAEQKLAEVAGMVAAWREDARHRSYALIGCPDCRDTLRQCADELDCLLNGVEVFTVSGSDKSGGDD